MVIDTSALIAIFLGEPERRQFLDAISPGREHARSLPQTPSSPVSCWKPGVAKLPGGEFDLFLHQANVDVVSVDAEQVEIARLAWRKYGELRHPAALNFGDCFAYALAKTWASRCSPRGMTLPRPISRPARD